MSKRINVILPDETIRVLDRVARKGDRSRFISEAVLHYVQNRGKRRLREQLKSGYRAGAEESFQAAAAWFLLEEEAWRKSERTKRGRK